MNCPTLVSPAEVVADLHTVFGTNTAIIITGRQKSRGLVVGN